MSQIDARTCVVRKTANHRGRRISVRPEATAARYLHYGRIVLDGGSETFSTEDRETAFIGMSGQAAVDVSGQTYDLGQYDALYVPRDAQVTVSGTCDVAEVAAPVDHRYPVQYVSFADVKSNPALSFDTGGASAQRNLNILIGKNVEAGRILAGVTFSKPGNWTSWPPHEHASLAEEAYLYIDMPEPGWGLQLVYTDPRNPELVAVVKQDDVVIMPHGYHPNVSAPGGTINFLWMMAANREVEDRQFGVVNVHPDYAQGGSGLEASRK
ncbi:MAG TPA: 5-deoxy-glucuronate isomerase [Thermoanaerobaculia bacterium]|nr:5-deoxy-glucuronate isomerase [Thermoanaerobaculia bacterium]